MSICDWIWEKLPSKHNYTYIKLLNLITLSIVLQEIMQILACNHVISHNFNNFAIYGITIKWVAKLTACHLDSFFTILFNTTIAYNMGGE